MKYEIVLRTKNTGTTLFEERVFRINEKLFHIILCGCEIKGIEI